uniref:Transposase n=1 Tax=Parastrongyloides trichosuri TaxID=131310 RepID=A0A0N4ZD52_PARTI
MTARWKSEKDKVGQGAQLRETLDRLRAELAAAQRAGDLGRASEIAYGQIPQLEKQLADSESPAAVAAPLTPEVVDAEQIAAVPVSGRPTRGRGRRGRSSPGHGTGPRPLPARVPEPHRRDHPVPPPRPRTDGRHRPHPAGASGEADGRPPPDAGPGRQRPDLARRQGLRPGLRRKAAEARHPEGAGRPDGQKTVGRRDRGRVGGRGVSGHGRAGDREGAGALTRALSARSEKGAAKSRCGWRARARAGTLRGRLRPGSGGRGWCRPRLPAPRPFPASGRSCWTAPRRAGRRPGRPAGGGRTSRR